MKISLLIHHIWSLFINEQKDTVKIALFGDQGYGENAIKVLQLIKRWDADLVLNLGDYDYLGIASIKKDNPPAFMGQFKSIMGEKFPLLSVVGNHEILQWYNPYDGYRKLLQEQSILSGISSFCSGEIGIKNVCYFDNMVSLY